MIKPKYLKMGILQKTHEIKMGILQKFRKIKTGISLLLQLKNILCANFGCKSTVFFYS